MELERIPDLLSGLSLVLLFWALVVLLYDMYWRHRNEPIPPFHRGIRRMLRRSGASTISPSQSSAASSAASKPQSAKGNSQSRSRDLAS